MNSPDPSREYVRKLANQYMIDEDWSVRMYDLAAIRSNANTAREYMSARILRIGERNAALFDLHTYLFPGIPAPSAWQGADLDRQHAAYLAEVKRLNARAKDSAANRRDVRNFRRRKGGNP